MSRRDDPIVACHEVPGKAPARKSRPVGYGVIRAGMSNDSKIRVTNSEDEPHVVFNTAKNKFLVRKLCFHLISAAALLVCRASLPT
jgi:hypothetical protein